MARFEMHYRAILKDGDLSLFVDGRPTMVIHLGEIPKMRLETGEVSQEAEDYIFDRVKEFESNVQGPSKSAPPTLLPTLMGAFDGMRASGADIALASATFSMDAEVEFPDEWNNHPADEPPDPDGLEQAFDQAKEVGTGLAQVLVAS